VIPDLVTAMAGEFGLHGSSISYSSLLVFLVRTQPQQSCGVKLFHNLQFTIFKLPKNFSKIENWIIEN